jgi:hypothetical protein
VRRWGLAVLLAALAGCAAKKSEAETPWLFPNLAVPLIPVTADGHPGVIFPELRGHEAVSLGPAQGFWTPSAQDVETLESALKGFLEGERDEASRAGHTHHSEVTAGEIGKILAHWGEYRRQYVGFVMDHSRRILVNSLPGPFEDGYDPQKSWTEHFVFVNDGGFWYWSVRYDVEEKRFFAFESHGNG